MNELNFIIQGFYGYGWEDVSYYPCGKRQINFGEAWRSCKHDIKEYRFSEPSVQFRIIKRYEPIAE